jgi:hypothetical protein
MKSLFAGVMLMTLAENPVIEHGATDTQVTLTGADGAALGNFIFKVTGHPAKGAEASNELRLTVAQK